MPFTVVISGPSGAGKTTLILKLIPELVKRGYQVGTVKNCPHGFDMDKEGKDSWKFSRAGSRGILLTSPHKIAFLEEKEEDKKDILKLVNSFFEGYDIVMMEGFSGVEGIKKIEILPEKPQDTCIINQENIIAFITRDKESDLQTKKPVFKAFQIEKIINFLEEMMKKEKEKENKVEISINGKSLPLNFFVKQMVKNLVLALVEPLKKEKEQEKIKEIKITVKLEEK
ncbi:molybdopterin-guanine dinucleotide biosynthesis protein B [Candidatus Aerophobetes bacterium]|nr:molybdopterin-guanine dinucleotide biosynthesis protein B [Candidatus Aerophobetes bacterium]